MFRGVLVLFLSGITAAQFPVLGDQQHLVSSITDYLEETEFCYKCDDEVASLKEVNANQSALLAQQAGDLAQQAGLISSLQNWLDSVVARVDSAEQFMNADIDELRQKYEMLEQKLSALENKTCEGADTCTIPSSCTEVAERSGINNQAFYVIDPDGPEHGVLPMVVQCDFQGDAIITLIGHNSEARTRVKGFEDPGSYSKDVTYWNSMDQVRAVVDQSSLCKQHIKYECHHSEIFYTSGSQASWWVTWDGRQADYWGGASPGSGQCACGQTGSCSNGCNCNANDYTWREDSGFLFHKDDLPVTQLRFGDTGQSGEEGYYTLGKLICYP
ncbi:contactin-associated protein-like 5 [Branchiostoma floridae]|uniref:Contactin-associated protein-like 5 n=1 Tax=Branchiostoma floridae TaxID=7739 RepID=A0A9J7MK37_BRAFL|nr:contactin-associated protein-like 5 [Branchiostoma floridae]